MRATGIVRHIDDLGRIVIPREIRKNLGIMEGDALELFIEDGCVVYRRYMPSLKSDVERLCNTLCEYSTPNNAAAIRKKCSELASLIKEK